MEHYPLQSRENVLNASFYRNDPGKVFDLLDIGEETRREYKGRIRKFLRQIERTGLNPGSFLDFKKSLATDPSLTVASKNKYLIVARVFLRELYRQGILPTDISTGVKTFKQSKKHKQDGLNKDEMFSVSLAAIDLPDSPETWRLRAMLCLLAIQGLRQIELIRLDVSDLDLKRKTALIRGKGMDDKERISLHPESVKTLQKHLEASRIADGPLFTSSSNNSLNRRLTTRSVRAIVQGFLASLEINKKTHGFRHFFTTRLIETHGSNLLEVAKYTRHRSLEMLQIYNDDVSHEKSLPKYYEAFNEVQF